MVAGEYCLHLGELRWFGPSFVIVTSTESEKEAASWEEGFVIEILEKEKVVYDNPKLSKIRDVNKNRLESEKDHPPKRE